MVFKTSLNKGENEMELYSAANRSPRVQLHCLDETRTVQSEAEACDINNIMKKYEKTGLIEHVNAAGRYENLPQSVDFQEAINLVMEAEASFEGLPAAVRKEFENDPAKFLLFVEDPENVERMGELGLLNDPAAPAGDDETDPEDPKLSQEAKAAASTAVEGAE